jgi:hypothetical protein
MENPVAQQLKLEQTVLLPSSKKPSVILSGQILEALFRSTFQKHWHTAASVANRLVLEP